MLGKPPKFGRMKAKRVRPANAAEKRHIDRMIQMGCLVCKMPAEYHHIHSDGFGKVLRDHRFGSPLCPEHHRGASGIHSLGHNGFVATYGIDLYAWAKLEWAESERLERLAA